MQRIGFFVWRQTSYHEAHSQIKALNRSQCNWQNAVRLRTAFAAWTQCARCVGNMRGLRWRWQAHGLALLRVVLGTWRLVVFETRTIPPSSGASTPVRSRLG